MGCGSSTPAKADGGPLPLPLGSSHLHAQNGIGGQKPAPAAAKSAEPVSPESNLKGKDGYRAEEAFQSPHTSSEKDTGSSVPSQLSSRRSLVNKSDSLDHLSHIPSGWTAGRSVAIRLDPRTAHICSLACSITKVPLVLVISQEVGRSYVASSPALEQLGPRLWLSSFCDWLFSQTLASPLTIEDTLNDARIQNCEWRSRMPSIRFLGLAEFHRIADSSVRLGFLVALDLQPHPGSTANAMLGNLASMAAREVDTPSTDMPEPQEWYTNGVFLPATLRTVLDNYSWATFLLDTTQPRWPVLYVNIAFQTMTGVPPGCIEGFCFWDFVRPLHPKDEEPWQAVDANVRQTENFSLPPVTFQHPPSSSSKHLNRNKQIYRVELRAYNEEAAYTYEVDMPPKPGLYFASFQPEARFNLDLNSTAPVVPEELPFPALELGPVIGKGSFGYVCKGLLGHVIVAVKIIEADAISKVNSEGLPMEVSLSKDLRHRNIVQMLDYATRVRKTKQPSSGHNSVINSRNTMGSADGGGMVATSGIGSFAASPLNTLGRQAGTAGGTLEAWLLIEYCDRGSLQDGMYANYFKVEGGAGELGVPNLPAIISTAYEIAAAMRYLHSNNILHGDLTAGNVLLASQKATKADPRGYCAKVADFGLSRQALTSKVETQSYGTVTHMPPELLNDGYLSKHADVYAYGVLLVEMYIGQLAFNGMRQPQIIHTIAVLKQHPELPESAPQFLLKLHGDQDFTLQYVSVKDLSKACMQESPKQRPTFAKIMDTLRPHIKTG